MWKEVVLSIGWLAVASQLAQAADCGDEVQRVTRQIGLAPNAPATSASPGPPADVTSRLNEGAPVPGNPIAIRRTEVLASLEAARAAAAQGNEQACLDQLAKAQAALQAR